MYLKKKRIRMKYKNILIVVVLFLFEIITEASLQMPNSLTMALSIIGRKPFNVIIGGIKIIAKTIAPIMDASDHSILRLCLGFNAILFRPCFFIIMDYNKVCELKNEAGRIYS